MLYGYSFTKHLKTDNFYIDLSKDIETFYASNYQDTERPFPMRKSGKVLGFMKEELCGEIKREFVRLRSKMYSWIKDNVKENKKIKSTKNAL